MEQDRPAEQRQAAADSRAIGAAESIFDQWKQHSFVKN
jgi:hypothetical protein